MQTAQSQGSSSTRVGLVRKAVQSKQLRHGRMCRPLRLGFGLCGGDRALPDNEEPPLGAHLVTPRFAYAHHGVYVGSGAVVHYRAFANHWSRGPVEEIPLKLFAHGHSVWVRPAGPNALPCEETVRRARSRLGEDRYRFFGNNCEHLSEWCVNGEHKSPQAESLLAYVRSVSAVFAAFMRSLKATPRRGGDCPGTRPTSRAATSYGLLKLQQRV
jgi:Lecithin retinol acyltransferase